VIKRGTGFVYGNIGNSPKGVVASGNLEVLLERLLDGTECEVTIKTSL